MAVIEKTLGGGSEGAERIYPKYADCAEGDLLVDGIYIDQYEGQYGKNYVFQNPDGTQTVLNGTGQLNYRMSQAAIGMHLKIVYNGEETIKKGPMSGKAAHSFTVKQVIDSDNVENAASEANVD